MNKSSCFHHELGCGNTFDYGVKKIKKGSNTDWSKIV